VLCLVLDLETLKYRIDGKKFAKIPKIKISKILHQDDVDFIFPTRSLWRLWSAVLWHKSRALKVPYISNNDGIYKTSS